MGIPGIGNAQIQPQVNEPMTLGKPFLKSLIVPGWGERSLGFSERGNKFIAVEAALWLGYGLMNVMQDRTHDELIQMAVREAAVNPTNKSDNYYDDVGNYMDLPSYNDQMLRDRNPFLTYPENQGYEWFWTSEADRKKFKDIKFTRNLYSHFALYMLGGITVNHLTSAIDAIWLQRNEMTLQASPILDSEVQGMVFTLNF
ncbi:MAG: hypothetical protein K9N11_06050 [Lentisphaeria bacterium]|nr:hypothetical protein [Candidatus Neomarinimicrobiota bacterium]MCF7842395.1 hypothetical protein [Lentisphaeria bacterium]